MKKQAGNRENWGSGLQVNLQCVQTHSPKMITMDPEQTWNPSKNKSLPFSILACQELNASVTYQVQLEVQHFPGTVTMVMIIRVSWGSGKRPHKTSPQKDSFGKEYPPKITSNSGWVRFLLESRCMGFFWTEFAIRFLRICQGLDLMAILLQGSLKQFFFFISKTRMEVVEVYWCSVFFLMQALCFRCHYSFPKFLFAKFI